MVDFKHLAAAILGATRLHLSLEDLKRYALGQLSSSEATQLETHLLECRTCRQALAGLASNQIGPQVERRGEVRVTVDTAARIKGLDPLTPSDIAQILDASTKGFKLRVSRPFFPGSIVQLRSQGRTVLGTVRYCIPSGNEFPYRRALEGRSVIGVGRNRRGSCAEADRLWQHWIDACQILAAAEDRGENLERALQGERALRGLLTEHTSVHKCAPFVEDPRR